MSGIKIKIPKKESMTSAPSQSEILPFTLEPIKTDKGDIHYYVGGPTYSIKEDLKKFGARWNVGYKKWWIPAGNISVVRDLLRSHVPSAVATAAAVAAMPAVPTEKIVVESDADDMKIRLQRACRENKSWAAGGLNMNDLKSLARSRTASAAAAAAIETMLRAELLAFLCKDLPAISVKVTVPVSGAAAASASVAAAVAAVLTPEAKMRTLDDLMRSLDVSDVSLLTTLTPVEIDHLVSILTLHDSSVRLADIAPADFHGRVRKVIEELGGKLCRCIKKVMAGTAGMAESSAIPICINSIFIRRGLKISSFQCKDGELLLPSAGSKVVLDRQPGKSSIK